MRNWRLFISLVAPLSVGLAASAIALGARHSGDAFTAKQRQLQPYDQLTAVEHLVGTAPAPSHRAANGAATARCKPGQQQGVLQNPWRCTLRYRSGRSFRYLISIHSDGSYFGRGRLDKRGFAYTIHGCCLPAH